VGAITGAVKEPHFIANERCIKCGQCEDHCPFDAISRN
jgi:formate hydrogenlyase subunit 6/NADH:ubiquinone oxidoreductase subunit I